MTVFYPSENWKSAAANLEDAAAGQTIEMQEEGLVLGKKKRMLTEGGELGPQTAGHTLQDFIAQKF